jgi:L-erythro-3,5-diaminohexanoate dehydrogenase
MPRPIATAGDAYGTAYGTHRVLVPPGGLPQSASKLDNDFARVFEGEALIEVATLNVDAASFTQMEAAATEAIRAGSEGGTVEDGIAHILLRTVREHGKQHNPVTGSGGMLLGRVLQVAPGRRDGLAAGDAVATLTSLTLTPLRIDRVVAVRRGSAQIDVDGEAVVFASGPCAVLPSDLAPRVALAALDVAGAAPQVARRVRPGDTVLVLGAGGKSGVLCAAEARRAAGPAGRVIGIEAREEAANELRALDLCDGIAVADARDPLAVQRAVLAATAGREADVTFSCVNVPGAELGAILATRDRGAVYFFAMSTSFTQAALGAEGVGKDVDLFIGNGFAHGHAEHTLDLVRSSPALRALFERRYG